MPKRYGWRPDLPHNKFLRAVAPLPTSNLPPLVDLRNIFSPPIFNQGDLGSCTGNGLARVFQGELMKQGLPVFTPSRLFIYQNELIKEGDFGHDNGAQIADGISVLEQIGVLL